MARNQVFFPDEVGKTTDISWEFFSPGRVIHSIARGAGREVYSLHPPRLRGSLTFGESTGQWADRISAFLEEFQDPDSYCWYPLDSRSRFRPLATDEHEIAAAPEPYCWKHGITCFHGQMVLPKITNGLGTITGTFPAVLRSGMVARLQKLQVNTNVWQTQQLIRVVRITPSNKQIVLYPKMSIPAGWRLYTGTQIRIQPRIDGRTAESSTNVHWRGRSTVLWEEYYQAV